VRTLEQSKNMNKPNTHTPKASAPADKSAPRHKAAPRKAQRALRATKAKVPYVEALAQDRSKLQAQLNKVTAQRDELLAACKAACQAMIDESSDGLNRKNWILDKLGTAIAKAEGSKS
jgi:hypothetical protein